ncbi:MAG: hypothetical protein EHM45_12530 [Desulfobacteraceae bacterium]|nr:MAG: hypothetical protein EHM45_12530 [Desulfobacteraceae bacterium]
MMSGGVEWTWSDGWLLMALFLVGVERSAHLHEVLGAADATNHAIPTTRELAQAFTKFAQCGLITVTDNQYAICPEHVSAIKKVYEGRGGLFASGDKGLKFLKRSKLVPKNDQLITLTDTAVEAAYKSYRKVMRKR